MEVNMKIYRSVWLALLIAGTAVAAFGDSITVTSPAGGESWPLGSMVNITWNSSGVSGDVRIVLIRSGGAEVGPITASIAASAGTFPWRVGEVTRGTVTEGVNYRIRIRAVGSDTSDQSEVFAVTAAEPVPPSPTASQNPDQRFTAPVSTIEVSSPLAPLTITHNFTISWRAEGITSDLIINLIKESGGTYTLATGVDPGRTNGRFTWIVGQLADAAAAFPAVGGERFRIRVLGPHAAGETRSFEIIRPALSVTEPRASQTFSRGDPMTIRWNGPDIQGGLHIEVWYNKRDTRWIMYQRIFSNIHNLDRRDWTIWPRPENNEAEIDAPPIWGIETHWRIRLISARCPWLFDDSAEFFIYKGFL
jgi:hypothetical protein